ncbi:lysophospholipid acyltransferase family protein [Williamsia muralis]|uniref:lysophospholipid acyltransferase family protein n=1 Tax=Williamsia marianensis TaxID=85044 RepID=UPI000DE79412|nr:lysophospholipid acyltransferase family protein [Williamsia marianensis]PVY33828.1 1-acyl-sn-glycerol-3-phosphate acyltransferase [Williamsia marianensis]
MWYWLFKYVLIGPFLRLVARPSVVGLSNFPPTGPVIVAANHLAVVDSLLMVLVLPRRVTFVAKAEYFTGAGIRGCVQRWFFLATGQLSIDRRGGAASVSALDEAVAIVGAGGVWGIHPEGTRSRDGLLHRGRTGVMRVALATGAPVVPLALRGTDRVNPPGARLWRPGKVHVVVGQPLVLSTFSADSPTDVREATDHLMAALSRLSGQQYVDSYTQRAA